MKGWKKKNKGWKKKNQVKGKNLLPSLILVSVGEAGVASMEQPESVKDSFILSSTRQEVAGDTIDAGDNSESLEAPTLTREPTPAPS